MIAPAARRIKIGSYTYAVRFPFRPHTPDERAELKKDIEENGVQVVPEVCQIDGVATLVDGLHRAEICIELGMTCPTPHNLGYLTEAEARRRAYALNVPRRHLSPAEQERARRERPAKVAAKRAEGKSLRTIADELGVGYGTARRALLDDDSGEPPGSPESLDEHYTVGGDGKTYRQPPKAPRVVDDGLDAVRKAERTAQALAYYVGDVLGGPRGDALRSAAVANGVTIRGDAWPALLAIVAALGAAAVG